MDTMVKEKDAAIERAIGFEAETEELNKAAQKFEKEVDSIQREIAKVEDNLDICMSSTKETADKLELADKEAIDAELQVKTSRVKNSSLISSGRCFEASSCPSRRRSRP